MTRTRSTRLVPGLLTASVVALVTAGVAVAPASAFGVKPDPNAAIAAQLLRDVAGMTGPAVTGLPLEAVLDGSSAGDIRPQAALNGIVCSGQVQNVQYSTGAGGAVGKVDVTCTGTAATVSVKVAGLLRFGADGQPYSVRAQAPSLAQNVVVNGAKKTWYLPQVGSNGGLGTGWWEQTYTLYFTLGVKSSTVSSSTGANYAVVQPPCRPGIPCLTSADPS